MSYFPPLLSLALGLGAAKMLELPEIPRRRLMYTGIVLLSLWAATSVAFFALVASWLLGIFVDLRLILTVVAVTLGLIALASTIYAASRTRGRLSRDLLEDWPYFPWDFLLVPEAALAVLAIALFFLIAAFVLLVLWLPLIFLALNILSLGELRRTYRAVLVEAVEEMGLRGREVGKELLRMGGTLSAGWDRYLESQESGYARKLRRAHVRVHHALLFLALSSLLLAASAAASRTVQWDGFGVLNLVAGGAAILSVVGLLWTLYRRRSIRLSTFLR